MAYGDAAEDGAVAVYDDVVFEDRVAVDALDGVALLVKGEALGTEGDALVELHVVAEDAGGTDYHACAVVDGEVAADGGGGMYVDTSLAVGHLGDDAGDEGYAQQVQLVGHAVVADGAYGGVAADDLAIARGGRVALIGGHDIGGKQLTQVGEAADELARSLLGLASDTLALPSKAKAGLYLLYELMIEALHIHACVVGKGVAADAGVTEVTGEEDGTAEADNLGQHVERGQGVPVGMMIEEGVGGVGSGELADDLGEEICVHCLLSVVFYDKPYNATHCSGLRLCVSLRSWNCIV